MGKNKLDDKNSTKNSQPKTKQFDSWEQDLAELDQ